MPNRMLELIENCRLELEKHPEEGEIDDMPQDVYDQLLKVIEKLTEQEVITLEERQSFLDCLTDSVYSFNQQPIEIRYAVHHFNEDIHRQVQTAQIKEGLQELLGENVEIQPVDTAKIVLVSEANKFPQYRVVHVPSDLTDEQMQTYNWFELLWEDDEHATFESAVNALMKLVAEQTKARLTPGLMEEMKENAKAFFEENPDAPMYQTPAAQESSRMGIVKLYSPTEIRLCNTRGEELKPKTKMNFGNAKGVELN